MLADPDGGTKGRARARDWLESGHPIGGEPEKVAGLAPGRIDEVEGELSRLGWSFLPYGDPSFPEGLLRLSDPPLGLFVRGCLPASLCVALVGARRATAYGREVAQYLGRELSAAGVWVASGMARGVDAAAHRGALATGGLTVAVWGSGPDRVYPSENVRLADEIARHGCLLTEYPPGCPPLAHHFPERNRLIAGLARVIVVVEADERSGALITARHALDEGREVMAVPGSVFSRLSAGPNGLLRAGAAPVLSATDILDVLGVPAPPTAHEEVEPGGLLAALPAGESVSVDRLAALTGATVAEVLDALFRLELSGLVAREADGRYRRSEAPLPRSRPSSR